MSKHVPNSFQVANSIVDDLLADMTPNAVKCYLFIVRKTTGWGKEKDRIALSQFYNRTGISTKRTLLKALQELEDLNLILVRRDTGKINEYQLTKPGAEIAPGAKKTSGRNSTGGGCRNSTGGGCKNYTPTKHTKTKHTKTKPKGGFSDWWNIYPRKTAKPAAEKAWIKHKCADRADALIEALSEQVKNDWRYQPHPEHGKSKIPYPATYLNAERWEDELEPIIETVTADIPSMIEKCAAAGGDESYLTHPTAVKVWRARPKRFWGIETPIARLPSVVAMVIKEVV